MISKQLAGGVVINANNEIAVVQQGSGISLSYSLPKGHIEDGETPLETAKREIAEETGITDLSLIKELGTYRRHPIAQDARFEQKDILNTYTFFLFASTDKALAPTDSENPRAEWIKKEDVANRLTHSKDKEFFRSIIDQL
ncbi:MAG: NUDIX domain-containing protein [Patescibacteria group bacterium]